MTATNDDPIKHVIVLMLENRSFDQLLGSLQEHHRDLDGIDKNATARVNRDKAGTQFEQLPGAWNVIEKDPHHDLVSVQRQIGSVAVTPGPAGWGSPWQRFWAALPRLLSEFRRVDWFGWIHTYLAQKRKKVATARTVFGSMKAGLYEGHFVDVFVDSYPDSSQEERSQVMRYFDRGKLPALHALAEHFTICDRWFSSVPGPTWANRFFFHSGTCLGTTIMPETNSDWMSIDLWDQRTIYDELLANDRDWRIYFHEFPQSLALSKMLTHESRIRYSQIDSLEADFLLPADTVPDFVFIEPQYLGDDANDDHPPHDSMLAQQLIARVYNALRANDALWNESLLIVIYDEHGGFYDHVEPPPAIPPDDKGKDYTYDQLGVRVPAVLVSPWVEAGVFSERLDHTSVGKYLCKKKWALNTLGDRMKAANTFDAAIRKHGLPRTDGPGRIDLDRPRTLGTRGHESGNLNANQKALNALAEHLDPRPPMKSAPRGIEDKPKADELRERAMRILDAGPRQAN